MSETVLARNLGEYLGWIVQYTPAPTPDDLMEPHRRQIIADELRGPWEDGGVERVGITDKTPDGPWAGTEHIVRADTPVTLVRPFRPKARRAAALGGGDHAE